MFAWLQVSGKQVRLSLKTSNLHSAKRKHAGLERKERAVAEDRSRDKMRFREALGAYLQTR